MKGGDPLDKMKLCSDLVWRFFERSNQKKNQLEYSDAVFTRLEVAGRSVSDIVELIDEIVLFDQDATEALFKPAKKPRILQY